MVKCEFCDAELSNNSNLKSHQMKTKYCIERQKLVNPTITHINFPCQYCDKNFTHKHRMDDHIVTCTEKIKKDHTEELLKLEIRIKEKDNEISTLKEEISLLKIEKEKANIYSNLFDKDHAHILDQNKKMSERQSVINNTTTTNSVKTINTMNTLNLSAEHINSKSDSYTMAHYNEGSAGQIEWLIPNLLVDEEGNLIYRCTDKNRKCFKYKDMNGNLVTDLDASKLKEAIRPFILTKLKEFWKIKCSELGEEDNEDESVFNKLQEIHAENKEMGVKFYKSLIEKTYQK